MGNQDWREQGQDGGSKRSGGCFVKGCLATIAIVVVLVALGSAVFWKQMVSGVKAISVLQVVNQLMTDDLPALQKEFPFDEKTPPVFDTALFKTYCQARADLCKPFEELIPDLQIIKNLPKDADFGELLEAFGPVAEKVKDPLKAIAPTLRNGKMSAELYVWITQQVWAAISEAGGSGDAATVATAKTILQDAYREMRKMAEEKGPEMIETAAIAQEMISRLGTHFDRARAQAVWKVILPNLKEWNGSTNWMLIDMAVLEGLEKAKEKAERGGE